MTLTQEQKDVFKRQIEKMTLEQNIEMKQALQKSLPRQRKSPTKKFDIFEFETPQIYQTIQQKVKLSPQNKYRLNSLKRKLKSPTPRRF